ncbi:MULTISPECIES: cytochrome P450 [Dietzia]|jgi:cytochrome P450|uniref:Cytochrome P450 n=1 Tax=Dietzia maris TaxID=37915 RepID=A0ABT8H2Q3_9ACTN|nr:MULTISPECIES: cytochrome P450 [Dietzia]MDJ0424012.1 cytochrome P450 [Dietzia kunjamensis]MDN4506537.1 cytochrome P450 [Dietzia maris]
MSIPGDPRERVYRPGPAPLRSKLPILGGTLEYVHSPLATMARRYRDHGPVSDLNFLGATWTALIGPDACQAALQNADKAFASGPGWGYLVGPFFNRGLMLLDFEEHHHYRHIMQEAFTRPRLEGYTRRLAPLVDEGIGAWAPDRAFQIYPALKTHTLDLATEVFMGGAEYAAPGELDKVNTAFADCVQAANGYVRSTAVPFTKWGRAARGRRLLEEFLRRHLPARRANPGEDLFSALCQVADASGGIDDDDIINQMIFLLMAAHDTTTSTVTSMVYELGRDVQWQERLRRQCQDLGPNPTMAELEELPDLALVMKESLRLHPPVPVMARKTVKDTEILGVEIPAGRLTSIMPLYSHHMPEYWTDPEIFDPERFSDERREDKSHRFAWEPFGGGVHKCLGIIFANLESKLVLSALLRHFEWSVPLAYVPPMKNDSLPYPADGLPVSLRPLARVAAN